MLNIKTLIEHTNIVKSVKHLYYVVWPQTMVREPPLVTFPWISFEGQHDAKAFEKGFWRGLGYELPEKFGFKIRI